jgi:hypothetical protein
MVQEWREVLSKRTRTSKTKRLHIDGQPTNKFSWDGSIASVHYKDALNEWQEVDPTLVASLEPGWDWEMSKSHWRLLIKNGGWIGLERGGVGFGFKLIGWTFLNIATKEYDAIRYATYGLPILSGNELTWAAIYAGVDYQLIVGPDGMGYSIRIPQSARDAIPAPPYPIDDTFFVYAYEVRWADCPYTADWESETWWKAKDQPLEPNRGLGLADVAGKVKAYLPLGWAAAVEGTEPIEMKHRYIIKDGTHYLLNGAKLTLLKALPAGDIVLSSNIDCGFFPPEEY